nr:hypothetical protein [uncultured Cellulosilyticum sp.]
MSEFICKNCGYRKTVGNEMGNMMEIPVYPMYEASVVAPFLAMEYMQDGCGERCPGCGKFGQWQRV